MPSGFVTKEALPAPALRERMLKASNSALTTAASSISITDGASDAGRAVSSPVKDDLRLPPLATSDDDAWCVRASPACQRERERRGKVKVKLSAAAVEGRARLWGKLGVPGADSLSLHVFKSVCMTRYWPSVHVGQDLGKFCNLN